ncbi:30S ribosomal protein S10 [Mycoplasma todarodis]|uniref:Small ribosomal subunit protein uS10 n=1 Tax=Mycoplasma todarodis TaxID=1937191 RepID=A0A4R0XU12_9MOLU|nr:30S ribosomal protein S10 [Mycoplasma todarodis]NQZ29039.1 30S ribosomal protein S10 [Mycoplasmatales bacterium]TCG10341.1 30S ribosomal protein S10 [Mycoplasma todarodis]
MAKVTIKVKAFEASLVDAAALKIVETAKAAGAKVSGPVPLPTKREVFTVLKSVHVNKKSREQFEIRTNKRLIKLAEVSAELMDKLQRLNLPSGVKVEVINK